MATATTVTVSYPADLSEWGRGIVEEKPFRTYLRKAHETATDGDSWEEFLGVGCCGNTLDVTLRVESVEGGSEITPETSFEFVERAACGVGGWEVQSAAGPE